MLRRNHELLPIHWPNCLPPTRLTRKRAPACRRQQPAFAIVRAFADYVNSSPGGTRWHPVASEYLCGLSPTARRPKSQSVGSFRAGSRPAAQQAPGDCKNCFGDDILGRSELGARRRFRQEIIAVGPLGCCQRELANAAWRGGACTSAALSGWLAAGAARHS